MIGVHALRNALIPVITVIGLQVGVLFAGAILTETIFSWPGIGKWMIDSISRRDYPSVQGGLLLVAVIVMLVNLVVDLLYGLINPRIRHTLRRTMTESDCDCTQSTSTGGRLALWREFWALFQ